MDLVLAAMLAMRHPFLLLDTKNAVHSAKRLLQGRPTREVGKWFGLTSSSVLLLCNNENQPTQLIFNLFHPQNELPQCSPGFKCAAEMAEKVCAAVSVWTGGPGISSAWSPYKLALQNATLMSSCVWTITSRYRYRSSRA